MSIIPEVGKYYYVEEGFFNEKKVILVKELRPSQKTYLYTVLGEEYRGNWRGDDREDGDCYCKLKPHVLYNTPVGKELIKLQYGDIL